MTKIHMMVLPEDRTAAIEGDDGMDIPIPTRMIVWEVPEILESGSAYQEFYAHLRDHIRKEISASDSRDPQVLVAWRQTPSPYLVARGTALYAELGVWVGNTAINPDPNQFIVRFSWDALDCSMEDTNCLYLTEV